MISGNRDEIRRFFVTAWRKYQAREELSALEHLVATVIDRHPEYHGYLDTEEVALRAGMASQGDQANPFLHMGMHIALEEQLQADRPEGIRQLYQQVVRRIGDHHVAEHCVMECLGNVLRDAQRKGVRPEDKGYLACLGHLLDTL